MKSANSIHNAVTHIPGPCLGYEGDLCGKLSHIKELTVVLPLSLSSFLELNSASLAAGFDEQKFEVLGRQCSAEV